MNWNAGSRPNIRISLCRSVAAPQQGERQKKKKKLRLEENLDREPDASEGGDDGESKSIGAGSPEGAEPGSSSARSSVQQDSLNKSPEVDGANDSSSDRIEGGTFHSQIPIAGIDHSPGLQPDRNETLSSMGEEAGLRLPIAASPEQAQGSQSSVMDSDSDDGVLINLENNEQESGQVSEGVSPNDQPKNRLDQSHPLIADDEDDSSDGGDAMMEYSKSRPVPDSAGRTSPNPRGDEHQDKPLTLAELGPEEFRMQVRYFHIVTPLKAVDRESLVRCLVCAGEGHLATACKKLTCTACGAFNQHFTSDCPRQRRCEKCCERGHDASSCPYKLRRIDYDEITCDLCQLMGHLEEDCELLWRTSGRPWESDFTSTTIRLSCYECGAAGHLGNDCRSRRPRKPMGTSTWSLPKSSQALNPESGSLSSQGDLRIKGKASRSKHQHASSGSDDDGSAFFSNKISLPKPTRQGRIHIDSQSFGRRNGPKRQRDSQQQPVHHDSEPNGEPSRRYGGKGFSDAPAQSHRSHRPADQRASPPRRGSSMAYDSQKAPFRRESPSERGARFRSRGNARRGESYRPMPSAARDAWRRYRS